MKQKKEIEKLIKEYTKEYVLKIAEESRISVSILEFLKECELPYAENGLKKSIEEDGGYWSVFCIHRINVIKDVIAEQEQQVSRTRSDEKDSFPSFKKKYITDILNIFEGYFSKQHFGLLKALLDGEQPSEKLLFKDNGNKLANVFRQLFEDQIITGCNKKELERWILQNFKYKYRGVQKDFTEHYLNDVISTEIKPCKNPIIGISLEKDQAEINIIPIKTGKNLKKW